MSSIREHRVSKEQESAPLASKSPSVRVQEIESNENELTNLQPRHPRRCGSWKTTLDALPDIIIGVLSTYFLIFACLVYTHRGAPVTDPFSTALFEAARYGPTLFPIVFAAIITKTLKVIAALNLENGTTVLTMEYLLSSRSVFSALTTPLVLRAYSVIAPCLVLLWLLSPLGGQASQRILSSKSNLSITQQNLTYLAYLSDYQNAGVGSTQSAILGRANTLFSGALSGSKKIKHDPQDLYGNVKIPLLSALPSMDSDSEGWQSLPANTTEIVWSSLIGLPVHGISETGTTNLTLNTAYMNTDCNVVGNVTDCTTMDCMRNLERPDNVSAFGGWSGANYVLYGGGYRPWDIMFASIANEDTTNASDQRLLSYARCNLYMSYVEVMIFCQGLQCAPTAVRPSQKPLLHMPSSMSQLTDEALKGNWTVFSPQGPSGSGPSIQGFWPGLINATNPSLACDTVHCTPSTIEAFLIAPDRPIYASNGNSMIWTVGSELFSQRMSMIFNTYWLASVAPPAVSGSFNASTISADELSQNPALQDEVIQRLGSLIGNSYSTDSVIGTVTTSTEVVQCNMVWLVILVSTSSVLILAAITAVVIGSLRRGPDILDGFSSLLKDNRYAALPSDSSMYDSSERSRNFRNLSVRFGDVQPTEDVGHAAIGTQSSSIPIREFQPSRMYV